MELAVIEMEEWNLKSQINLKFLANQNKINQLNQIILIVNLVRTSSRNLLSSRMLVRVKSANHL